MRYCQKLCIGAGASFLSDLIERLSSLLGLFFAVYELDTGNYLWDQLKTLESAPMLLSFQTKFEDHGQRRDS
jgi:hypothetical protein